MGRKADAIASAAKLIFQKEHAAFRRRNPKWAATRPAKRWRWLSPTQKLAFEKKAKIGEQA